MQLKTSIQNSPTKLVKDGGYCKTKRKLFEK